MDHTGPLCASADAGWPLDRRALCFTRVSWGQGNDPTDGGIAAIRYDETRDKSGFCVIVNAKSGVESACCSDEKCADNRSKTFLRCIAFGWIKV